MLSDGVRALIAHVAFWSLLAGGWFSGALKTRTAIVFLALWAAALIGNQHLGYGNYLFVAAEALLAAVLVLIVLKRDVGPYWWRR